MSVAAEEDASVRNLEAQLGYRFQDPGLLARALTHRSGGSEHNERLEFLGDAALGYAVSCLLFDLWPHASERDLTLMRASIVRNDALAAVAQEIDLGRQLRLGQGEKRAGARSRASILADALEAVFGALAQDGGPQACLAAAQRLFGKRLAAFDGTSEQDAKSRLQQFAQARRLALPRYRVERVEGSDHAPRYVVSCRLDELGLNAVAEGGSRRDAEQLAAREVLGVLP